MVEVDHVKADLREHTFRLQAARDKLRRAQEDAQAHEHRLAASMRQVIDAGGIIVTEAEIIDRLLEQLHELVPRPRQSPE